MRISRRTVVSLAAVAGLAGLAAAAGMLAVRQRPDLSVYLGLLVAIAGFASALLFDRQRLLRFLRGRQARYGGNAALAVGTLLAILVLLNLVAFQNPRSWDLTEDRRYSLAPETIEVLKAAPGDVRLIGFFSADQAAARDSLRPLLQRYQEEGAGRVSYEFVDPRQQPIRADEFGVTRDASLVVALGGTSEVVAATSELEITQAIMRLSHPGSRKVYFLTGHGERDTEAADETGYSQLRQTLESKNYAVDTLSLLFSPQVPDDASAVVVAGPTAPLAQAEIEALRKYQEGGGGLVVLTDPTPGTQINAEDDLLSQYLVSDWGLDPQADLVVDLSSSMPLAAIAAPSESHPITDRLQTLWAYFPMARSIGVAEVGEAGPTRTELLITGQNSWGETTLEGLTEASPIEFSESDDMAGPLTVAAAAEVADGARVVAIGDSDFGANADFLGLGNGSLLVSTIDWAARQDDLIGLMPKKPVERYIAAPSRGTLALLALISVILVPAVFLAMGVAIWWGRRGKV